MRDERAFFHALMRGLVARHFPKQANAALEIADLWGGEVDHGGFSRKMNGSREWALSDAVALMRITGSRRIAEAMLDVLEEHEAPTGSPTALAGRAAKEAGEAVAAALALGDPAEIQRECMEAEEAFRMIRLGAAAREAHGDGDESPHEDGR